MIDFNLGEYLRLFFQYYFTNNIILLIIVVCLFFILLNNSSVGKKNLSLFKFVLLVLLLVSIFDTVDYTMSIYPITKPAGVEYIYPKAFITIRHAFSILAYTSKPAIPMFLLYSVLLSRNKAIRFLWIPMVVVFFVYAINLIPNFGFYYINENNHFTTVGDWGRIFTFSNYLVGGFYVVILVGYSIFSFRTRKDTETITLLCLGVLCFAGFILSSIFVDQPFIGDQTAAVGSLFIYLILVIKYMKIDGLTELFNRQTFYTSVKNSKNISAIISIDMNGLKRINDTDGHKAGDEALLEVAKKLLEHTNRNVIAYRMGGDEFLVTCTNMTKQQVTAVVNNIDFSINKQSEYDVAIGFKYRENNEPIELLMHESDQDMYKNKLSAKKDVARQLKHSNKKTKQ